MSAQQGWKGEVEAAIGGDVEILVKALKEELAGVAIDIDAPSKPEGEWWLDISLGDFSASVAWRPEFGFGVFTSEPGFGDRPDEVFREPETTCRRLRQLAALALDKE
jgi:hypothetical protein